MWGNDPLSTHLGSACDLRSSAPFKGLSGFGGLMGSSPAGKKSPEKQPDSADMGIWKDSSWEDCKLNLVNVSLFCTPHLYGFKSFLGLPGRIFASKENQSSLVVR